MNIPSILFCMFRGKRGGSILPSCLSVRNMHACCSRRSGVRVPGTGVREGGSCHVGARNQSRVLWKEQQISLLFISPALTPMFKPSSTLPSKFYCHLCIGLFLLSPKFPCSSFHPFQSHLIRENNTLYYVSALTSLSSASSTELQISGELEASHIFYDIP